MKCVFAALACAFFVVMAPSVSAWTPELLVTPGDESAGSPCLVMAPDGRIHAAYVADYGQGLRIFHRVWLGDAWSTAEQLPSPGYKTAGTAMDIDSSGRIHIVAIYRVDGTIETPYTVYYWEFDGSTWLGPTMLSDGQGGDSDTCTSPRLCVDRYGTLHVVWQEGNRTGGKADLIYRRRAGGVWQSRINLTNNGASGGYGSCSPDMAIDLDGNGIHIVWHDGFSGNDLLYYMKSSDLGNTWPDSSQWVRLSNADYGKGASVVLDRNNRPNVWWTDMDGGGTKFAAYRRWNGSAWTGIENWSARPFLDAAFDAGNVMHLAYVSNSELHYCTYNYSAFSPGVVVSTGADTYKVDFASLCLDSGGYPSVLWEERKGEWPGHSYIFYSTNAPQGRPSPVASFAAAASCGANRLSWVNPSGIGFSGTVVCRRTDGYPTSTADGTVICNQNTGAGKPDAYVDRGLINGVTYYYAAFARGSDGQYSDARLALGTPWALTCRAAKGLTDSTAVNMCGKVISAVFPTDGCIYVEEPDRTGGIRAAWTGTGLLVGDTVSIEGTVGTRVISSQPAERQISASSVAKVSPAVNDPVRPVAMGCLAVGGAASGLAPGVKDGVGLNNMGTLVRISGKVTLVIGGTIYVDDGSDIPDTPGRTGVMVKLPAASSLTVGDIVSVTGIVEGSIPAGWNSNRRYIHTRDWNDLVIVNDVP